MGVLNTTPRTWSTSEVVTAAEMNAEIHDPFTAIQAAWTAYTPTTTGITLGNGTVTGNYNQAGKTIDFVVVFTFGSTSAITGSPTFTLPATALRTQGLESDVAIFDTSVPTTYPGAAVYGSTTVITARTMPTTAGNPLASIGATVPMTWAAGDILTIKGRYEAA